MRQEVIVNVFDQTAAVAQDGFGLPLVFDPAADIDYQEVSSADDLTGASQAVSDAVNIVFAQEPSPGVVAVYGVDVATASSTIADELDALLENGADAWYWLILASQDDDFVEDVDAWVGGQTRIASVEFAYDKTTADVVTELDKYDNPRLIATAHDGGDAGEQQNIHAGIVGRIAALTPGSYTAKYKTVNTAIPATYKTADLSSIIDANGNTYVKTMGQNYFTEGVTTAGTFIDIEVAKDWFKSRLQEAVFGVLKRSEKVPYDDGGISQVVGAIKEVNAQAVRNGIVALDEDGEPMIEVSFPRRADTTSNDRAERILKDVRNTVTIAGAIHNATIDLYFVI